MVFISTETRSTSGAKCCKSHAYSTAGLNKRALLLQKLSVSYCSNRKISQYGNYLCKACEVSVALNYNNKSSV